MFDSDSNLDLSILKEERRPLNDLIKHRRAKSLIGQDFGRLTPIGLVAITLNGDATWLCYCECGQWLCVRATHLRANKRRSCGKDRLPWEPCYKRAEHGNSNTRLYRIWATMMQRCYNPNAVSFQSYGANNVRVDARWHAFENFLEDMGQPPSPIHSLDRYPNQKGNYGPGNCRWATPKEQARNTRRNIPNRNQRRKDVHHGSSREIQRSP